MKSLIITTILATSALAASAQNGETYGHMTPEFGTPLSRAEVLADLREAQDMGTIAYGNFSNFEAFDGVAKPRNAVLADLGKAQHEGTIRYGNIAEPKRDHH